MEKFPQDQIAKLSRHVTAAIASAAKRQTEEAVHHIRVSTRRFQQALKTSHRQVSEPARKQLKKIMKRAGDVRDLDIALKYLKKHEHPTEEIEKRRQEAKKELAGALRQRIALKTRRQATKREALDLPGLVKDFFQAGRKAIKAKRTWRQMHKFRLATKKFRYTMELFRPAYGQKLDDRMESLKKIQQLLGDINDAVNIRALLDDINHVGDLREKLTEKAGSHRSELQDYWTKEFDAGGEKKHWMQLFKEEQPPVPQKLDQQKVRSRR